jgi:hypothetical protein
MNRAVACRYRVDFWEGQTARVFGFYNGVKAYDKFVEGVSKAYDEVCIYQFDGGAGSAVLLARFYLKHGRIVYHGREESSTLRNSENREAVASPRC